MAVSELLSVYRESLASERQSRYAEMQLALTALQFEAEKSFREEGRQRENALFALAEAKKTTSEAKALDSITVYQKLLSIEQVSDYLDDDLKITKPEKVVNKLVSERNFSPDDATRIVNIVSAYSHESTRPAGERMVENFSNVINREYDIWKRSGFADNEKSALMAALEDSGVLYDDKVEGVVDPFQRDLSVDAFLGVSEAGSLLDNIGIEIGEIGAGDYIIDRPVLPTGADDDVSTHVDLLAINIADKFETGDDYLGGLESEASKALIDTKGKISDSLSQIEQLEFGKRDIQSAKRLGEMTDKQAKEKMASISKDIKEEKEKLNALNKLEKEAWQKRTDIRAEKVLRRVVEPGVEKAMIYNF